MTHPDAKTLLARAHALLPRLEERAAEAERSRRVPAETIAELHEAGLFHMLQPARFGGYEMELVDFIDIVYTFASACPSTAWVYGVLTSHAVAVATFPEAAQIDVWDKMPNAVCASAFVPTGSAQPVEGGFCLSGSWPFASACDFAQWALLGGSVATREGHGSDPRTFLAPMSQLAIVDDWQVLGLSGTGSKTLTARNIFIPHHRTVPFAESNLGTAPGGRLHENPLYRCPRHACTPAVLAIVPIGIARGAIDAFIAYATRKSTRRGGRLADQETIQLKISEAEAEVDAARLLIRRNCIENLATLRKGFALTIEQRARNRRDHAFATKLAVQAVDRLMTAAGAHGLYSNNALPRLFRDVHAAAAHLALNWEASGIGYGQLKLGVEPVDPYS